MTTFTAPLRMRPAVGMTAYLKGSSPSGRSAGARQLLAEWRSREDSTQYDCVAPIVEESAPQPIGSPRVGELTTD
jgi:hypothetical protein